MSDVLKGKIKWLKMSENTVVAGVCRWPVHCSAGLALPDLMLSTGLPGPVQDQDLPTDPAVRSPGGVGGGWALF